MIDGLVRLALGSTVGGSPGGSDRAPGVHECIHQALPLLIRKVRSDRRHSRPHKTM
jgi:hypothetical protein